MSLRIHTAPRTAARCTDTAWPPCLDKSLFPYLSPQHFQDRTKHLFLISDYEKSSNTFPLACWSSWWITRGVVVVCSQFCITFLLASSCMICSVWLFQSTSLLCTFTLFGSPSVCFISCLICGVGVFSRAFNIQQLIALEATSSTGKWQSAFLWRFSETCLKAAQCQFPDSFPSSFTFNWESLLYLQTKEEMLHMFQRQAGK